MVKRITYLTRRPDLTPAQFRGHWATTHADIARDLPGVVAYRQNHVVHHEEEVDARRFDVDGIVELWFEDATAAEAGFGSDMADRLIIDERQFLSGLTGASVTGPGPSPQRPGKLWLLWADDTGADDTWAEVIGADVIGKRASFEAAVHRLAGRALADSVHIDWLDVGAPVLFRSDLRRQPLPLVVASLGFDGVEAARYAAGVARAAGRSIGRPQRAVAEEISIIQPATLRGRG